MDFWKKVLLYNPAPGCSPNTSLQWCGTDTEEAFRKLSDRRGYTDTCITYNLNEYGFRSKSFNDLDKDSDKFRILVSGCSHTFGVGNRLEETWPVILANKFPNSALYNIGAGGQSPDYTARSVYKTIDIFKPHLVVVLWPDKARAEYPTADHPDKVLLPCFSDYPRWYSDSIYQTYTFDRNKALLEVLTEAKQVQLLQLYTDDAYQIFSSDRTDYGRDNHFGKHTHSDIANYFYQQYLQSSDNPV